MREELQIHRTRLRHRSRTIALDDDDIVDDDRRTWRASLLGFVGHLLRSSIGLLLIGAGGGAIIINALYLQPGPHPAPIFPVTPSTPTAPAQPSPADIAAPRPRPADITPAKPEPRPAAPVAHPALPAAAPRDPIADLINPPPQRVMAVQRALSKYGYGQIKVSGIMDRETQSTIKKFESERRLPVTGEITERLMRELVKVTGQPVE